MARSKDESRGGDRLEEGTGVRNMGGKMTSDKLKDMLFVCSQVNDFELVILPRHSKRHWALYYPGEKLIEIYGNDSKGKQYPLDVLLREALHELAHHFQYTHIPFWTPGEDDHDPMFWELYQNLLDRAFGENILKAQAYSEDHVASVKPLPHIIV